MATKEQYAKWCLMLIEGDDHMVDEIIAELHDDGLIDDADEWIYDDEEE